MATTGSASLTPAAPTQLQAAGEARQASAGFNWVAALLSAWLIGGLFLDGWAHSHGRVDDVFFTPWHAVMYSGALAIVLFLGVTAVRNIAHGSAWRQALPAGYGLSLLGAVLFATGGVFDLGWHLVFGVEVNIEALLSPSHLLLATGGVLMITGPLRAAWHALGIGADGARADRYRGWRRLGPVLLSAALLLSVFTFFTSYAHFMENPAVRSTQPAWRAQSIGVASILLPAILLMGVLLPLMRRFALPFGALLLVFGVNSALMAVFEDRYLWVPAFAFAGLLGDLLLVWLEPWRAAAGRFYAAAFLVPASYFALYFAALALTDGIAWTLHLWLGAIVIAGAIGVLLAVALRAVEAPAAPAEIS
jgi:hypothetical protein